MAGRIQGITVEIGGDTTKLQTALKGVNTEIRNTQSQLRDVDKLLKLDPGNTELLAQKHRLLGDAVKETKEKLETLKMAAEQAEQALKDGTITQDQYDGLQREIVETEQKLKALEEQARSHGKGKWKEKSPLPSMEEILREEQELGLGRQDMFALILSGLITIVPVVLLILLVIFLVVYLVFLR